MGESYTISRIFGQVIEKGGIETKERYIEKREVRYHVQDNGPGASVDEAILSGTSILVISEQLPNPNPQNYILSWYLELFLSMDI
ncbi:hypothetical protein DID88_005482 [Monilinia fructigena]|uniref:Uncharacterized protein n=1 Tax=Monilinia fructigena TaxID=38457 RepID=A0A395J591_9HELO|nr:hypothetical protein DID88_005482 [Monilinia fructigena]